MVTGRGPTAKLCEWASSTQHAHLPPEVRKETLTLLSDEIGCMIASATLPSCQPVVDFIHAIDSGGTCTIVGHPVRASVTNAALANGTIGHGAEVDATSHHGAGHYASTVVPTGLTVGEYANASGENLVRALAIGSETAARIQNVLYRHRSRPQFAGSVSTTMGATVVAGLLIKLDAAQMEDALGLAASAACGLLAHHEEEWHQNKSLEHGKAAEAGVMSALLVQKGFHGPKEVLTIQNGFFDAFAGQANLGHEAVEALGEKYLMRQITYKRYPVGGPTQPLYGFLQLLNAERLAATNIEQIEVLLSPASFRIVTTNKHPSINLETILSIAAVHGDISFAHIHEPEFLNDPRVRRFRESTRIVIIPRSEPHKGQRWEMAITVRTRDGKTLRQETGAPLMTETEVRQKFRSLAGRRLNEPSLSALEHELMNIEQTQCVAPLVRRLALPY